MAATSPIAPPGVQKQTFADLVAQATGLDVAVVTAWVQIENGPVDNPLNIGPGRHYGSMRNAAKATVALLHNPRYRPILQSAGRAPLAQIHAIAASPWDAGHYGGDGRTLRGTYQRVIKGGGSLPGAVGAAVGEVGSSITGALTPDVGGWIGSFFDQAKEPAARALLYLTFTALAIAFLVLGGVRAFGGSLPRRTYTPPNLQDAGFPEGF